MTHSWSIDIDWLGRAPTNNEVHRLHYQQASKLRKEWREAGCMAARLAHIPSLPAVRVTCWGHYPNRRSLPDPDAVAPTLKAVLDGLVDARVIVDDTGAYVHAVTYEAPRVVPGRQPGLTVWVYAAEATR